MGDSAGNSGSQFVCSNCGNSAVQKVSAICRAGSWSGQSAGVSVGGGHVHGGGPNFSTAGVTAGVSSGATQLARDLAPPPEPRRRSGGSENGYYILLVLGGCLALASGGSLLAGVSERDTAAVASFMVVGVMAIGCFIAAASMHQGLPREREALAAAHDNWKCQMIVWDALYYCPRCDHVYVPQTGQAAPASMMRTLL